MLYRLETYGRTFLHAVDRMDSQQWLLVSAVAVVVGAMLLSGYGSRTSY